MLKTFNPLWTEGGWRGEVGGLMDYRRNSFVDFFFSFPV